MTLNEFLSAPERSSQLWRGWLGAALLTGLVIFAYWPSKNGEFIWDDEFLVRDNALVHSPDGLRKLWMTAESPDYCPMAYSTFWVEWRLWGSATIGYHIVNVVLHVLSSLLIWGCLRKLRLPAAYLAALLFAIHPVNVESVAWISQRRGTLATFFFLLSIRCSLQFELRDSDTVPGGSSHWRLGGSILYLLSLVAFVLGMLSKGSVVILPPILLLVILWQRRITKRDLVRLAPFFGVAIFFAITNTSFAGHSWDGAIRNASFVERVLGAGTVVWFYLSKVLLPLNLTFIYPQWQIESQRILWWVPLASLAASFTVLFWNRNARWARGLLLAWSFFCVALVPVIGFADVGFMRFSLVADHYAQIAIIGAVTLLAAVWSVCRRQHTRAVSGTAYAAAVVVVGLFTFAARNQSTLYRDTSTIFEDTLQKNPNCWLAENNLGVLAAKKGSLDDAIRRYKKVLAVNPDFAETHNNYGNALRQLGRNAEAVAQYQKAIELKPDYADSYNNLGNALKQLGRLEQAMQLYRKAVEVMPKLAEAHNNLAVALVANGQTSEAIKEYEQALALKPDFVEAHFNFSNALAKLGQPRRAIEQLEEVLRLRPDDAEAAFNAAGLYAQLQEPDRAIEMAKQALELARRRDMPDAVIQIEAWLKDYQSSGENRR